MDGRAFVKRAAATAAAAGTGLTLGAAPLEALAPVPGRGLTPDPRALIFDAMGELRPDYEAELRRAEGSQVQASELPYFIDELNGPRRMEVVWDGLVVRGYSQDDVERIMGGNLLRLYRDVIG